jgi:molecular chaperone DnaK
MAMQRLKEAAEKAKIELSTSTSTEINLPYIMPVGGEPKHLVVTLTRAKFEQLANKLINMHAEPISKALKDAKLDAKDVNDVILVGGTTRIPAIQELVKKVFGKEPSHAVNPDEAVALGASIQGAVLNKEAGVGDIVLLDVTPLTLGIETLGGVMTKLIDANTTIPFKKSETFSTAADNQTEVTVHVLQGERPMAADNKSIGKFNLTGIMPAKRGIPQIEVTFDIDANGILTVSAKDKATGREQKIRIEASSNLSKEEVERMKAEAAANADADKKAREAADAVNKGEAIAFSTEKMLEEQKDNVTTDEKAKIESLVKDLREATSNKNVARINEIEEEINKAWNSISERVYGAQASQGQAQNDNTVRTETTDADSAENVQDADFEEVS